MLKTDLIFELRAAGLFMHVICIEGMVYHRYSVTINGNLPPKEISLRVDNQIPIEYLNCPAYTKYGDCIRFLMTYLKKKHYWYYTGTSTCYMRRICLKLT